MTRNQVTILAAWLILPTAGSAQASDLRIFGYSQNAFEHIDYDTEDEQNSFLLQQLNVFVQKPLAPRWTSFVNFEMVNSYSSFRRWGAFNLEEAWLKYRHGKELNLKFGLQIPIFNNLNEIKNRTPLLPYIIRPLVYESSFNETISLDEFVPSRAFVQGYGFIPRGAAKLDYAIYLGNSPNINDVPHEQQTGVDTTGTVLIGGRLGVRHQARRGDIKLGVSLTHDHINGLQDEASRIGYSPADLEEVRRIRLGLDFSAHFDDFSLESETIRVKYDDDIPEFHASLRFHYVTLGYQPTEDLTTYVSYWYEKERLSTRGRGRLKVPNIGAAYNLNDRVTVKVQFAPVDIKSTTFPSEQETEVADSDAPVAEVFTVEAGEAEREEFNFFTIAISAIF